MKTVITDNSLCVLPLSASASCEHIGHYIKLMAKTGVRYMEMDYAAVGKMRELPDEMKYIFRLGNPMFKELARSFDFSYVLITVQDLKEYVDIGDTPVILEVPMQSPPSRKLVGMAQEMVSGPISMIRLRYPFPMLGWRDTYNMVNKARNILPLPVDFCPINTGKTGLDSAIKLANLNADCLTLCMGMPQKYVSLEEFLFTLMAVHDIVPPEVSLPALCAAECVHRMVFGDCGTDALTELMRMVDRDIVSLVNVDTGERVPVHIRFKDKCLLNYTYENVLKRFAEGEEIPDDLFEEFSEAIKSFDLSSFNDELYTEKKKILQ